MTLSTLKERIYISVPIISIIFLSTLCTKKAETIIVTPTPTPVVAHNYGSAQSWVTTGDQTKLLTNQGLVYFDKKDVTTNPIITIDSTVKYQSIDGFGAALTGSSASNINRLNSADKKSLLNNLFDATTGIGISYLRITIGASDFSDSNFSYDDVSFGQTDFDLKYFSIAKDQPDLIPLLKLIKSINPTIKILACPWSAPAWMKTSSNMVGGSLRKEAYAAYANYFVKYIQAFQNEGITIDAVTPQNEPLYYTATYPCMSMLATEQTDFIKNNLGPAFKNAGITTKIIIYDHNWDHPEYPMSILADTAAAKYISGSAFHGYGGTVGNMLQVHQAFPNKDLYFTEISGGEWAPDFSGNLIWNLSNIFIGTVNNWSKSALMWNLALDQNHGPTNHGCDNCRGVVTINSTNGTISNNVEYYAIGHLSKFVKTGAVRIGVTNTLSTSQLDLTAFMNPDGTKVIVAINPEDNTKTIVFRLNERQLTYIMTPKSVVTLVID